MTVASSVSRTVVYGNGAATAFAYPFKILSTSDLTVIRTTSAGVDTTLTLGTHYSVSGAGSENGGSVTYPLSGSALPVGDRLTIRRAMRIVQDIDLTNQGPFYAEVIETGLDRLTLISQDISGTVSELADEVAANDAALRSYVTGLVYGGQASLGAYAEGAAGAAARPVADKLAETLHLGDFGVVGDGATDDTAGIQAALNEAAVSGRPLDFGRRRVYAVTNLVLPDTAPSWGHGDPVLTIVGRGSTILKLPGGDGGYLMASERYVGNVAYSQVPARIYDLVLDGAGIADHALVIQSFFSILDGVTVRNAVQNGLHVASHTQDGTALLNGLSNNEFYRLRAYGNGSAGIFIDTADDTVNAITDWILADSFVYDNGPYNVWADCAAGAQIRNCHLYHVASGVCDGGFYLGDSFGSAVVGCIFEGDAADPTKPCAVIGGNAPGATLTDCTFWSRVNCLFEGNCRLISFNGCDFVEDGQIWHAANDPTCIVLSSGNTFASSGPYQWSTAPYSGRIVSSQDYSAASGVVHGGEQRPGGNVWGGYATVRGTTQIAYVAAAAEYSVGTNPANTYSLFDPLAAQMVLYLPVESVVGRTIRVVRNTASTGASDLRVSDSGGTPVKDLPTNAWADFYWGGSGWNVTAAGTLY